MNGRSLPAQILRHVYDPRWGGGLHREHLAELLMHKPDDKDLVGALMFLYKRKEINFIRRYVVATVDAEGHLRHQHPDRCAGCGYALDPVLIRLGFATHGGDCG